MSSPLLEVRGLTKTFAERRGWPIPTTVAVRALDGVSFDVARGEALGIVGESGCGKSTVARACLRLIVPDAGSVRFDGIDVVAASASTLRTLRRRLQIVFQDPASALDPRQRIADALGESIRVHGLARGEAVTRKSCTCSTRSVCRHRRRAAIRTSSRADNANASASPARWRWGRIWCSRTSRCRRSTSACRRRSWCCSTSCAIAPSRLRLHLARPRRGAAVLPASR
jgi:ABC-type glutathione transport system ATPase component